MWGSSGYSTQLSSKQDKGGLGGSFIPGIVIGFTFGMLLDLTNPTKNSAKKKSFLPGKSQQQSLVLNNGDQELKLTLDEHRFWRDQRLFWQLGLGQKHQRIRLPGSYVCFDIVEEEEDLFS